MKHSRIRLINTYGYTVLFLLTLAIKINRENHYFEYINFVIGHFYYLMIVYFLGKALMNFFVDKDSIRAIINQRLNGLWLFWVSGLTLYILATGGSSSVDSFITRSLIELNSGTYFVALSSKLFALVGSIPMYVVFIPIFLFSFLLVFGKFIGFAVRSIIKFKKSNPIKNYKARRLERQIQKRERAKELAIKRELRQKEKERKKLEKVIAKEEIVPKYNEDKEFFQEVTEKLIRETEEYSDDIYIRTKEDAIVEEVISEEVEGEEVEVFEKVEEEEVEVFVEEGIEAEEETELVIEDEIEEEVFEKVEEAESNLEELAEEEVEEEQVEERVAIEEKSEVTQVEEEQEELKQEIEEDFVNEEIEEYNDEIIEEELEEEKEEKIIGLEEEDLEEDELVFEEELEAKDTEAYRELNESTTELIKEKKSLFSFFKKDSKKEKIKELKKRRKEEEKERERLDKERRRKIKEDIRKRREGRVELDQEELLVIDESNKVEDKLDFIVNYEELRVALEMSDDEIDKAIDIYHKQQIQSPKELQRIMDIPIRKATSLAIRLNALKRSK